MNAHSIARPRLLWGVLAVALLTIAAHWNGVHGQFVDWDDTTHITQNPIIRALTLENIRMMFTGPAAKLYVPLTWLSFAVDYQLWGHEPFGYHLTNLVLHLANTLLVLALVYNILRDRSPFAFLVAVLTAAVFGVHPLRVESVAWATERKDVLFVFFFLLSVGAYIRWVNGQKWPAYAACLALFVTSALSKSAAVTLPVVLLLMDGFLFRRRALLEKIPFFAVSAIIGFVTLAAQTAGEGQTVANTAAIPLWGRLGLVGYCCLFYLKKFLWPFHLSAVYPTFDEFGWTCWTAIGYILGFILLTGVIVVLRRRAPVLLPSWLFYLITLLPTIGLVPVGIHVVADRYSYLPLIGLALPLSFGLVVATDRLTKRQPFAGGVLGCCVAVFVISLAVLSAHRTRVWENTETLFQNAIQEDPNCLPAYINLTKWYTSHRQFKEAIECGQHAVTIAPEGLPGRKNLAHALIQAGRPRDAIEVLRILAEHNVRDLDLWWTLGECFVAEHDWKNASVALETALGCANSSSDRQEISAMLDSARQHLDRSAGNH